MAEVPEYVSYLTNGVGTISGTVCLRSFNYNRKSIMIQNLGAGNLYVGGSNVSTSNGVKVIINGDMVLNSSQGAAIYVTSDSSCNIRFLEEIV